MRNVTSRIALACVLGAIPAMGFAQTTTQSQSATDDAAQTQVQSNQTGATESTADTAASAPVQDTAPAPEAAPVEGETEMTSTAPAEEVTPKADGADQTAAAVDGAVDGQIVLQSENSILADDLIGTTVYSATDESVGDINDVIISFDAKVEGVVIGVGGFLGMGEKEVAIRMEELTLTTSESGRMRLILNATREELEAAPTFKTAAAQRSEREAERMQSEAQAAAPVAPSN